MKVYRINTSYRLKYQALVILANFLCGLVSVLTLGFFAASFEMDAHVAGMLDKFKE